MPIELNDLAKHLGQMLMQHKDLPWNKSPAERAKMPVELRICFDLFEELRSKGLSQAPSPTRIKTFLEAARFLAEHSDGNAFDIASDQQTRKRAFRRAVMKLHPDTGGDAELYRQLIAYNQILEWAEQQ